MPQTILLSINAYQLDVGTNTTNPLSVRMRIAAEVNGTPQNSRLWFLGPDEEVPAGNMGFRASDGAFALFFPRRDFNSYVLMLDQARATHMKVELQDNGHITLFELSTAPFPVADSDIGSLDFSELQTGSASE